MDNPAPPTNRAGDAAVALVVLGVAVVLGGIVAGQVQSQGPAKFAGLSAVIIPVALSVFYFPIFLAGTIIAGRANRRPEWASRSTRVTFPLGLVLTIMSAQPVVATVAFAATQVAPG